MAISTTTTDHTLSARKETMPMPTLPWVRAVREIGFPSTIALIMIFQMLYQVPKEIDRIVKRLDAMESAYAKQSEALIQLLREKR